MLMHRTSILGTSPIQHQHIVAAWLVVVVLLVASGGVLARAAVFHDHGFVGEACDTIHEPRPFLVGGNDGYSIMTEQRFQKLVEDSMDKVRAILDHTRHPQLLSSTMASEHTWNDKFTMAEFVTNIALASIWHVLDKLLLTTDQKRDNLMATLHMWLNENQNIFLRFEAQDSFVFRKEFLHKVDLGKTTDEGMWDSLTRNKVVTERTEYHWNAEVAYKVTVCRGACETVDNDSDSDSSSKLTLLDRKRTATIITLSKNSLLQEHTIQEPVDLDLTWLIQTILNHQRDDKARQNFGFKIDREQDLCRTPSRNLDIQAAQLFAIHLKEWALSVSMFFHNRLQTAVVDYHEPAKPEQMARLMEADVRGRQFFNPVLPLTESNNGNNITAISAESAQILLDEHARSLTGQGRTDLLELFPDPETADRLISSDEAYLVALLSHGQDLAERYMESINYMEHGLRQQLAQAIGRQLTSKDFDDYMRFYYSKIFHPDFVPRPFSQAIRRPGHYPDGILSIENGKQEPIVSLVRRVAGNTRAPFLIPINAATSVEIAGNIFVHGWMQHRFEFQNDPMYLTARARQFSSFLLLIGTIAGPNQFLPKSAMVLQNKDEVLIPLLTEVLPSAKEFKDAIASLSPEQQEFAKAFRDMQLGSSVFGVCVIQIKPQLEMVLGLPDGALTKEIQLTQDLLSLFVEYQIPSDLLSFDGPSTTNAPMKLAAVKEHVQAVLDMIDKIKIQHLEETTRRAKMKEEQLKEQRRQLVYADEMSDMSATKMYARRTTSASAGVDYGERSRMASTMASGSADTAAKPEMPEMVDLSTATSGSEHGTQDIREDEAFVGGGDEWKNGRLVSSETSSPLDFTMIPKILDRKLDQHDKEGAVKSIILSARDFWTRNRQQNLLSPMTSEDLPPKIVESETKQAMDLLDAISRSGSLPIDTAAELHVIIPVAHCFDKTLVETVLQDNVNPIASVEKSLLLLASAVFGSDQANEFLLDGTDARQRLEASLPSYFSVVPNAAAEGTTSPDLLLKTTTTMNTASSSDEDEDVAPGSETMTAESSVSEMM